jgi:hypothetical protein
MEATPQEKVLKYLADQGLTMDVLSNLSGADIDSLPGPDGPLTKIQTLLIKAAIAKIAKERASASRTGTRTKLRADALEEENKALRVAARPTILAQEENDRLRVEAIHRKGRVSAIMG